tara:strand:+ start:3444 stop:4352 length:909 start_codon:yes stop_codon:yes gene_type:complete
VQISEEYKIIQKLGTQRKRKFGTTYLVENKVNSEKAVLKSYQKKNNQDALMQRLVDESSFSFNRYSLPKVIQFEQSENEALLLLRYKEGITIDAYWKTLRKKEKIPFLIHFFEKIATIFKQLLEGNVVHCDIKPSNILIEKKHDSFEVHLIDFGLAIRTNKTTFRPLLFPLGFAAPELLLNHLDIVSQKTDQFSLGIVIWRLFANQLPLAHPNPSIFTNLQLTHPLPANSNVPRKVIKILARMTVKHQFKVPPNKMMTDDVKKLLEAAIKERYSSFEEVLAQFKALEKQENGLQKLRHLFTK